MHGLPRQLSHAAGSIATSFTLRIQDKPWLPLQLLRNLVAGKLVARHFEVSRGLRGTTQPLATVAPEYSWKITVRFSREPAKLSCNATV